MSKKSENPAEQKKETEQKEAQNVKNTGEKAVKKEKSKPIEGKAKPEAKPADTQVTQAIPKISEDFGEWFNEIIARAEIEDYRYNVKGCGVWMPYGFKIRKYAMEIIRNLLDNTPIPHNETLFPLLVPKDQFMKEAEHVKGFEDEVFWVTHGGLTPLEVPLALRPTSETVMYPMYSLWIRAATDLPLKMYQLVNTFRYETKNTRPMIRVREITTFKEAHTCHATAEDCENQIREGLQVYSQFFDILGVPYMITQRPKWDTFPGADYTIAFDCIFPGKHRTLQIGTVHNLGQTFAKTFEIKFLNAQGTNDYVYQTCYGMSERVIAAILASHGDDLGLKLTPNIAPIQAVIIPIIFKGKEQLVYDACDKLEAELKAAGIRVQSDKAEQSSGSKFYYWEMKGVPIRIEIGPKDIEKQQLCLVRRDIAEKEKRKSFIPRANAVSEIKSLLETIQTNLRNITKEHSQNLVLKTNSVEEALTWIEDGKGIAEIPFCGKNECAAEIEKRTESLRFLGIPDRYLHCMHKDAKDETGIFCVQCQEPAKQYWRISRTY